MAQEIERKYIVTNDSFKAMSIRSYHIIQGYIHTDPRAVVRVRIRDDKAFLTIKVKTKEPCVMSGNTVYQSMTRV